ncbi:MULTISPECIES: type IV pilus twitching motility protein PilT [unclassified Paenibacillus]|uniref:type IV pilus twitching motility protein PilT n=1 Tax=unclassified Paenibacillus TaxID=185978 RepID=UPI001C11CB0E|nr:MULTISPECIES: type IV pilus twitching motility protein PilT [unclassified Paenibacillus]MBU5444990.1 type IV pilus twitching motility protein PilT [Paenibacillus sp. MSJ-34]CAH0121300.1 Twitching mobility protein [Paenibacillus sp. CECT 9249]
MERLDKLLRMAFELGASDLHLTVGVPPIVRVNGELKQHESESLTSDDTVMMAKSIMTKEQWDILQERRELDFSFGLRGLTRFRVNVYYQRSNIGIALRLIPSNIPALEDLHVPSELRQLAAKAQGLILVTGPTGSGKSTTLAALIDYMNKHMRKHIITLEDPIEYLHKHQYSVINQREIGNDSHNFTNGLRAALRQDPDVILVGELRDLETISIAVTAAETGHLVLGTLHTPNAPATIDRILDVFPSDQQPQIRAQLASVLLAILSQRLFPTIDHKARRVATELLINTNAVANLIREHKVHQITNFMQTGKAYGMHTLDMSMNELINQRVISREAAEPYFRELK